MSDKKRSKTVFTSREIPHLWMHKAQGYARNPSGSLYFNGDTIYSYGTHFPIARHVDNGKGKSAILFTTKGYSNTTAQHISQVRRAIPTAATVFNVPAVNVSAPIHTENLRYFQTEVTGGIRKAARARLPYRITESLNEAREQREACIAYCKFFKLKCPKLDVVPELDTDSITQLRLRLRQEAAANAAETKKRKEKERKRKAAAYLKLAKEWMANHPAYAVRWDGSIENAEELHKEHEIVAWRTGESISIPYNASTMLRIKGNEVETSLGARFPVAHAHKALTLVRAVMARGEEWHTNGHTCHLGFYKIDRITPDGTVYAGCHVVTWPEIERIAPELDNPVPLQTEHGKA